MTNKFTQKAQNSLNKALIFAEEFGHTYIGSEHMLFALLCEENSIAKAMLTSKGLDKNAVKVKILEITPLGTPSTLSSSDMSPALRQIIEVSSLEAEKNHSSHIGTEHILRALLEHRNCVAVKLLDKCGISVSDIKKELATYISTTEKVKSDSLQEKPQPKSKISGAPTLSLYGKDLSALCSAGKIDPIIGRDKETENVIRILSRRMKNNPCLIGEPGVGKTAVIEGLATRIHNGQVPLTLKSKKIVALDISSMLAGAKYRGEFEERIKNVMEEISKNPDIILFIDEFHTVVGAGAAEGAVDAANIIKPALARSELQIIGATTLAEYRAHVEKDAALERRFQPVIVNEPTEAEAIEILRGLKHKYEEHHSLKIPDSAIIAAVKLSVRYIPDRFLPDKAIDLIDEAASQLRISSIVEDHRKKELEEEIEHISIEKEKAILAQEFELAHSLRQRELSLLGEISARDVTMISTKDSIEISENDIANIVTAWTGIPISKILQEEAEKLISLEDDLKRVIVGQNSAIKAVSEAIRRGRVGLKEANRPIGSFIFVGSTGVGKTELSRAIASTMFGGIDSLIRFDMAEYMEKHSVSKLIGSPPGYVGYGEGGQLTEKIRRHPYSVVLFDEIEKAHPDVFNIFLSILEDGTVTDSAGRRIDFRNTIIIMTSNIGSTSTKHTSIGFSSTQRASIDDKNRTLEELKATLSPEFLNRVDEIIVFNSLSVENISDIATKMLCDLKIRAKAIGISFDFSENVPIYLAESSYNERFGARSIRREIVQQIENKLSELILDGTVKPDDTLTVDIKDNSIIFVKNDLCIL